MDRDRSSSSGSRNSSVRYTHLETRNRNRRRTNNLFLYWKVIIFTLVLTLFIYYVTVPNSSPDISSQRQQPKFVVLEQKNANSADKSKAQPDADVIYQGNSDSAEPLKADAVDSPRSGDMVPLMPLVTAMMPPASNTLKTTAVTFTNEACVIPEVPLKSDALKRVPIPVIPVCEDSKETNFSKLLDDGTLVLMTSDLYSRLNCCVYEIIRPWNFSADTFKLKDQPDCLKFNEDNHIALESEYLMVACNNLKTNKTEFNFHAQVKPSTDPLASTIKYWEDKTENIPVSIMVLVLDSTSRLDAMRSLPKTMDFLLKNLNFVDFGKFHDLGEPTMRNAIPLLTGVSANELFEGHDWFQPWDNVPFIWGSFNKSKYVTAYIEDIPSVGTFNYGGQAGFQYPPTSLYMRPFFAAFEDKVLSKQPTFPRKTCVGPKTPWKVIYDYQLEIMHILNGKAPTFTMPWLCWPFHDYFRTLSAIEQDTLELFQQIAKAQEILENTVLIVMADHGFYGSPYSFTYEGYIERRLPLFLIRLPEKLTSKYPEFKTSIIANSKEVVSHFDVYKTLLHLSQLSMASDDNATQALNSGLGQSLLKPLPSGRGCQKAGIPENFCACNLPAKNPNQNQTSIPYMVEIREQEPYTVRKKTAVAPRRESNKLVHD